MKKKIVLFIVLLLGVIIFYSFFVKRLPGEFHLWTDDKYWHTALLKGNNIIVPPTVVDYHVFKEFIIVLSVNRSSHYSEVECKTCLTNSFPCSQYWIINWKTGEQIGPMNKATFLQTTQENSIPLFKLKNDITYFSGNACNKK